MPRHTPAPSVDGLKGESQRTKRSTPKQALPSWSGGQTPLFLQGGTSTLVHLHLGPRQPCSLPTLNRGSKWHCPVTGVQGAPATPHLTAVFLPPGSLAYFSGALMDEDRWGNIIPGEVTVSSRLNQPRACHLPLFA